GPRRRERGETVMKAATAAVLAALALISFGAGSARPAPSATPHRGGVYRMAFEQSFGFSDNLDPTGEYFQYGYAILTNLLVRTLVQFDHGAGAQGDRLVPDLATGVPAPTDGGKTYTFHLKSGIRFGPPVNRAVTSRDVLYAFERIA